MENAIAISSFSKECSCETSPAPPKQHRSLQDTILPLLQGSGEAAANHGVVQAPATNVLLVGYLVQVIKPLGVGPQFSALEAIQVNLAGNGSLSGANSSGTTSGSGTTATSKPNAGVSLVPKMEALGAAALLLAFSIASFA